MTLRPPPEGMHDFLGRSALVRRARTRRSPSPPSTSWASGRPSLASRSGSSTSTRRTSSVSYHLVRGDPRRAGRAPRARLRRSTTSRPGSTTPCTTGRSTPLWLSLLDGSLEADRLDGSPHRPTAGAGGARPGPDRGAEQHLARVRRARSILKVYRRAHQRLNPDVEVHAALARVGSPHVAQPYGWIDGRVRDRRLRPGVPHRRRRGLGAGDRSVRDLLREGDLHADEVGGDFAGEAVPARRDDRRGARRAARDAADRRVGPSGAAQPRRRAAASGSPLRWRSAPVLRAVRGCCARRLRGAGGARRPGAGPAGARRPAPRRRRCASPAAGRSSTSRASRPGR